MTPIPLGILAASGIQVAAGAYDLLETEILTGTQASVTFSSLNSTYGADYQHLQIRMSLRSDRAGQDNDVPLMTFNSDTGSNYAWHWLQGDGSSVTSAASSSTTSMSFGYTSTAATSGTDVFASNVIDILDPFETTKYTTIRQLGGNRSSTRGFIFLTSGVWMNTAALTDITIDQQYGSNWVSASRVSLYGLKGA